MRRTNSLAVVLLLVALVVLAGCADPNNATDNPRNGGFYGGVSGGLSR